jgi:hypothetical protein
MNSMKAAFLFSLLSIALFAGAGNARADEDDVLIQQVITQASKNSDPAVAEQVRQYVNENRERLLAILRSYGSYLNQAMALESDDQRAGVAEIRAKAIQANQPRSQSTVAQSSTTGLQTRSLQTGGLQPSSALHGAHLAGYPALPDGAPTSSIEHPTAAQVEHGRQVDEAIRERKRFHMQNPTRYER